MALYWFMFLVLTVSYTADVTARLGLGTISTAIKSLSDLKGKTIAIDPQYSGLSLHYGTTEIIMSEHSEIDLMIQDLLDGNVDALILDNPVAEFHTALD